MNLTDLERELDAACGGMTLADKMSHEVYVAHGLLRDCHKLLASYDDSRKLGSSHAWHKKRVELMERIESVAKA